MKKRSTDEHSQLGRKNRRDTLIVIGLTVVIIAGAFLMTRWINPGYSHSPFTREEWVLDDQVTISAYGKKQSQVEAAVSDAFASIDVVDAIANRYRQDSEISLINANAAEHPVAVSDELWEMISIGVEAYKQSNGLFDITIAPWPISGMSWAVKIAAILRHRMGKSSRRWPKWGPTSLSWMRRSTRFFSRNRVWG